MLCPPASPPSAETPDPQPQTLPLCKHNTNVGEPQILLSALADVRVQRSEVRGPSSYGLSHPEDEWLRAGLCGEGCNGRKGPDTGVWSWVGLALGRPPGHSVGGVSADGQGLV